MYLMLLHYLGNQKDENCAFSLKCWMLFCQQAQKTHWYYHLVTAELPFILARMGRVHRRRPRKGVYHAAVCYHTLIAYQVCRDVSRCVVKSGSCSLSSLKWIVNGEYWWDILLHVVSQQMLAVIKHVVDDNIICLSGPQLMHAPVHGARNAIQFNSCCAKLSTSVFLSYGPNRPELNSIYYRT